MYTSAGCFDAFHMHTDRLITDRRLHFQRHCIAVSTGKGFRGQLLEWGGIDGDIKLILPARHVPTSDTYAWPFGQVADSLGVLSEVTQVLPAFKAPSRHLHTPSQNANGYPAQEESVEHTESKANHFQNPGYSTNLERFQQSWRHLESLETVAFVVESGQTTETHFWQQRLEIARARQW